MQEENWKAIAGYEGAYEVSDHGRVRSLDRVITYTGGADRKLVGKQLSPATNSRGYLSVGLSLRGRVTHPAIHVLVARHFLPSTCSPFVNHKDFDKTNNRVENLEWVTHLENITHARLAGRMAKRLTYDAVQAIRGCRMGTGRTYQSIADEFGIHKVNVGRVLRNEIWKVTDLQT